MYYICYVVIIMWSLSVSCIASLPFANPLQWPHGIVQCPLDAHFRILLKVVIRVFFILLFYILWSWNFSNYYKVEKYVISDTAIAFVVGVNFSQDRCSIETDYNEAVRVKV